VIVQQLVVGLVLLVETQLVHLLVNTEEFVDFQTLVIVLEPVILEQHVRQ